MKFRSKPTVIEANQFTHGATAPQGVFTREDGSCYVITIHGQETNIEPGDWIILEPGGDGTRAYPCKPDIFKARYQLACYRCEGDGKAHGADRPFESDGEGSYPGDCPVCHGSGVKA